VIVFYVKSLLYIADYATVLQADIVVLLIDLIVQIDIDIQVDDIEDYESDIFTMDDVTTKSYSDSDSDSIICITSDYKVMLTKIDSIMSLLMNYMKELQQKEECLYDFYYAILDAFDRIMLPTHKLKYAQFLLFYICSLVPDVFPEDFMGLLITHLLSTQDSNVIRMAASAYLGSLIARAKYIHIESVRHCLKLMCSLSVQYVETHGEGILKVFII
jgi:RNA polymerase I-specific transcription initiation factor RRN3